MTYSEKLRDPRWQKKRLDILNRDGFRCQLCDNDKETLAIHHKKYTSGKDPWDYPDNLLITLCEKCHKKEHSIDDVKAKEDSKTVVEEWYHNPPFMARIKDLIPAMKIRGVYENHLGALAKIRKEISERNKTKINGANPNR